MAPDDQARHRPTSGALAEARREARRCTRCPLHALGTQTVFGAGPAEAQLMLVGEQPGDEGDRAGLPFVGPAGQLLDRALGSKPNSPVGCAGAILAVGQDGGEARCRRIARGVRRSPRPKSPGHFAS